MDEDLIKYQESEQKAKRPTTRLTRQNVRLDKNTVGQLIITSGQNVRRNKHSIGQKTITFVGFFSIKKMNSRTYRSQIIKR